jgi:hypothetical protein
MSAALSPPAVIDITLSDSEEDPSNKATNSTAARSMNCSASPASNDKSQSCPFCSQSIPDAVFDSHIELHLCSSKSFNPIEKQLREKIETALLTEQTMNQLFAKTSVSALKTSQTLLQSYYDAVLSNIGLLNKILPELQVGNCKLEISGASAAAATDQEMKSEVQQLKRHPSASATLSLNSQPNSQFLSPSNNSSSNINSLYGNPSTTTPIDCISPSSNDVEMSDEDFARKLMEEEEESARQSKQHQRAVEEEATLAFIRAEHTCVLCKKMLDEALNYSQECNHRYCSACLHNYLRSLIEVPTGNVACPAENCGNSHLADRIVRRVLSEQEFDTLQRQTLDKFVSGSGNFVKCASCSFQFEALSGNSKQNQNETDNEGKPLTEQAKLDKDKHRFRCPQCSCIFCRNCHSDPYHLGFTCEEFSNYKEAKHCRFCSTALNSTNTARCSSGEKPGLLNVCNQRECLERKAAACGEVLGCGHYCYGISGEKQCLSCLEEDCKANCTKPRVHKEEFCNICWVSDLSSAPCIQTACGHIFHLHCIKGQLEKKWPSARVTFKFLNCPLCNAQFSHPAIDSVIRPLLQFKEEVTTKAFERLKFEGLENDKEVVDPQGKYYKKPVDYAMDRFAYYPCSKCKAAYFGGRRVCGEAVDADGNSFESGHLVCGACQSGSDSTTCKVHGKDYIDYKCKFCCDIATFFCWSTTHFCNSCHKKQMEGDYVSKKKPAELPQCGGTEKTCPLKVKHPQNGTGTSLSLGCGLCRSKSTKF